MRERTPDFLLHTVLARLSLTVVICPLRLLTGGSFRYYGELCLAALQVASGYRRLADRLAKLALSWPRSRLATLAEEA